MAVDTQHSLAVRLSQSPRSYVYYVPRVSSAISTSTHVPARTLIQSYGVAPRDSLVTPLGERARTGAGVSFAREIVPADGVRGFNLSERCSPRRCGDEASTRFSIGRGGNWTRRAGSIRIPARDKNLPSRARPNTSDLYRVQPVILCNEANGAEVTTLQRRVTSRARDEINSLSTVS